MKSKNPQPPALARRMLLRFLRDDLAEEVLGDLEEKFYATIKSRSLVMAKLNYWYQVMHYLRPFAIRRSRPFTINQYVMFQSYFTIGWRNLLKNKGYSFLNISGLALGMTVAILNGLWIWDEFSFNRNHNNYDRIAQVAKREVRDGERSAGTTMTYPLGTELITNYSGYFKHIVRTSWTQNYILSAGEAKRSGRGIFMDTAAPEMFSLRMLRGSWAGLKGTHTIFVSATTARALFGTVDILDKVIAINNKMEVKVTGVYEDLPLNSKFHGIDFLCPWLLWLSQNEWIEKRAVNDWRNHFIQIYVEIPEGTDHTTVSGRIRDAELNKVASIPELAAYKAQIFLHPMSRWHLFPFNRNGSDVDHEPLQMVWLVGIIGAFVLLLACINFMNLSTARSEKRAKEVGIRKTIGSRRAQLVSQFYSESLMVVCLAFVVALLLVKLFLPSFNDLAAKQIIMPLSQPWFWMLSGGFIVITGFLAGSYPALFLSSFQPAKVLKGAVRAGRSASLPRKVLVVLQFSISVALIIGTAVVYQQIRFAKDRPVGYSRAGLLMMEMKSPDFYGKYDVLRNELKNTGVVEEMAESMGKVTEIRSGNNGFTWEGKDPNVEDESFGTLPVTHDYGKTVGWQFVAGRDFSRDIASDSMGLIVNESAAKRMGLKNPVGESVRWTWWRDQRVIDYKILGVVKDMVMESPYAPAEPTLFFIKGHNGSVNWINIRLRRDVSAAEALPRIEQVFKKIIPSAPFEYKFADQEYGLKFAAEERISKLASVFGTLAVIISCLGLFGLASFVAEQRTKEIGIRKVVGASVYSLWRLLSRDFVVLVVIACAVAVPSAIYALEHWLEKFPYRTEIPVWISVTTIVGVLAITLFTVSYQAIRAALANPVKSLRSE